MLACDGVVYFGRALRNIGCPLYHKVKCEKIQVTSLYSSYLGGGRYVEICGRHVGLELLVQNRMIGQMLLGIVAHHLRFIQKRFQNISSLTNLNRHQRHVER